MLVLLNLWQRKLRLWINFSYFRIFSNILLNIFSFSFQFNIQFDDSLTATFEYPSETSLLIDEALGDDDEVDANFYGRSNPATSTSSLLNSVPLGKWLFPVIFIGTIWCYMFFRFDAIRKLSAAESERNVIWVGHLENHSIAIISIKRGEHIHIESRVRRWGLFKAGNGRRKPTMEQRRYERNRFVILSFIFLAIIAFNYRRRSIPCLIYQEPTSARLFQKIPLFCFQLNISWLKSEHDCFTPYKSGLQKLKFKTEIKTTKWKQQQKIRLKCKSYAK